MGSDNEYTDTSGSLAREAGVSLPTVKLYCDLGLLEFTRAANGVRLLRRGQSERVKEILAQRLANRGHRAA